MESTLGYDGSEDMIRNKFHNFIKEELVGIMKANIAMKRFTAECEEYQSKHKKLDKKEK